MYHGPPHVLTGQRQVPSHRGGGGEHSKVGPAGRLGPLTTVYPPLGPEMLPPPRACPQPVSLECGHVEWAGHVQYPKEGLAHTLGQGWPGPPAPRLQGLSVWATGWPGPGVGPAPPTERCAAVRTAGAPPPRTAPQGDPVSLGPAGRGWDGEGAGLVSWSGSQSVLSCSGRLGSVGPWQNALGPGDRPGPDPGRAQADRALSSLSTRSSLSSRAQAWGSRCQRHQPRK